MNHLGGMEHEKMFPHRLFYVAAVGGGGSAQDLNVSDWYGYNPMSSVTEDLTMSDVADDENQSFGDMVLMASPIKGVFSPSSLPYGAWQRGSRPL